MANRRGSRPERRRRPDPATAWSAAGRAPSSARCTGSRRAWTMSSCWSPARCRRIRQRAKASAAELGLDPRPQLRLLSPRWRRPRPSARTASRRWPSSRPTMCTVPAAKAFLEAGIHVICDKPLTTTLAEAKKLAGGRREDRQGVRADPQLHRLSDGAPGARDGRQGRSSATSASCRPNIRRTG